jgi:hypothetical protein
MPKPVWNPSSRAKPSPRVVSPKPAPRPATRYQAQPTPPRISSQSSRIRLPANPIDFKPPPPSGYVPPKGRLPELSAFPPAPPKGVRFAPDTVYQGHERIRGQYRNFAKLGPSAPQPIKAPTPGYVPPWGKLPELPPRPPSSVAPGVAGQASLRGGVPAAKPLPSPRLSPGYGKQGYISSHVSETPY